MAGQYSGYAGAPATGDETRMPSQNLWAHVDAALERPGRWMHQWTDFADIPFTDSLPTTAAAYNGLRVFTSSGGTFSEVDAEGGVRALVEATDNEGVAVGRGIYPFKIIQDAGELVFEARVKRTNITGVFNVFVGLIQDVAFTVDIPLNTDNPPILADYNMVGFFQPEGDPDAFDTTYKADGITAVELQADAVTLVADTYVKLGMTFNSKEDNVLRFYKDGLELDTTYSIPVAAGTDFPNDIRLGWVLATRNGASAASSLTADWVRCAQKNVIDAH